MRSDWARWPDMPWVGPRFWGNRLQDWRISGGKVECVYTGPNRSLHCLTHQLSGATGDAALQVDLEWLAESGAEDDQVGFRIGARARDQPVRVPFEDYRRNAVFGEGLNMGIDGAGRLFIGEATGEAVSSQEAVRLRLQIMEAGGPYRLTLEAIDLASGKPHSGSRGR